jgi:hypothetical protein
MNLTEQIYEFIQQAKDNKITVGQAVGYIVVAMGADKAANDQAALDKTMDQEIEHINAGHIAGSAVRG